MTQKYKTTFEFEDGAVISGWKAEAIVYSMIFIFGSVCLTVGVMLSKFGIL